MRFVDVFNGDADGLCALHQLRLVAPRDATLVTGVKRDIALLQRVAPGADTRVTVLDVSLDQNRQPLLALLQSGAVVEYFDHHFAGEIPAHPGLCSHIETGAQVCTSMLVDRHLGGAHTVWAVVGAFGDNLAAAARRLAGPLAITPLQLEALRELGESLNYNAYVDREADLIVHPARLYGILHRHVDPFGVMDQEPLLRQAAEPGITPEARAAAAAAFRASVERFGLLLDSRGLQEVCRMYNSPQDGPARDVVATLLATLPGAPPPPKPPAADAAFARPIR